MDEQGLLPHVGLPRQVRSNFTVESGASCLSQLCQAVLMKAECACVLLVLFICMVPLGGIL